MKQYYEIWRDIPEYAGRYKISTHGRIYCIHLDRLLVQSYDKDGYLRVKLNGRLHRTNRLVLITFMGDPFPNATASHMDAVKTNNDVDNLVWESVQENNYRNSYESKFGSEVVSTIKYELEHGGSIAELANKYAVSRQTITRITGFTRNKIKLGTSDISDMLKMKKQGCPHSLIANTYGISKSYATKILTNRSTRFFRKDL